MCLNRTDGVFSPTMFHPTVFDTGLPGGSKGKEKEYWDRLRLLKEDEEILALIIAIGSEE